MRLLILADNVHGAVGAAVVEHEKLYVGKSLRQHRVERLANVVFHMIDWYAYRHLFFHDAKIETIFHTAKEFDDFIYDLTIYDLLFTIYLWE